MPAPMPPAVLTSSSPAPAQPSRARPPKPVDHCAHHTARQLVLVSVAAQHAWFCAHAHTVFDTPVTTGMSGPDTHTPLGHYHIQGRNRHATLTLNTGRQYQVQYWVPFDAPLYGFHDSAWQHFPYGSQQYRTRGSHGCIHLPLAAMKQLYEWAHVGASVVIHR
jgi:lipoprotein-anchoring transpeptidase ErfK/SrfK